MMRRRRRAPYAIILATTGILVVGIIGFFIGYRVYPIRNNEENKVAIENKQGSVDEVPNLDKTIVDQPDETTPVNIIENSVRVDTKLVFRTHYTQCQTIKDVPQETVEEMIGLKENALKEYVLQNYKDWQVVRFSTEEIILFQRKEQICPDHYFVSEMNGLIVVFKFNEAGERYVVEKTNIPVSHLPDIDQEKIKRGILIRTRAEVNQLLEDYSS